MAAVAAAVIAIAGTEIAAATGITAMLGAVVGETIATVIVGAVVGGVANMVMGGDFVEGALFGGLAAGIASGLGGSDILGLADDAAAPANLLDEAVSSTSTKAASAALTTGEGTGIAAFSADAATAFNPMTTASGAFGSTAAVGTNYATKFINGMFENSGELIAGAFKGWGEGKMAEEKLDWEKNRYNQGRPGTMTTIGGGEYDTSPADERYTNNYNALTGLGSINNILGDANALNEKPVNNALVEDVPRADYSTLQRLASADPEAIREAYNTPILPQNYRRPLLRRA